MVFDINIFQNKFNGQYKKGLLLISIFSVLLVTDGFPSSWSVTSTSTAMMKGVFNTPTSLSLGPLFGIRIKEKSINYNKENPSNKHDNLHQSYHEESTSRRNMISSSLLGILTTTSFSDNNAYAKDELFKPNPLTNPILEQIRVWEQAEADELKYGGELAPGSPLRGNQSAAYAKLLVPILDIDKDISSVYDLIVNSNDDLDSWKEADRILNTKAYFQKVGFKKVFNAFADNIYYSDPDRANLYLGGGATPRNEQSIAYLLRNDILTNIEDLQAELSYLLKERTVNEAKSFDTEDLYNFIKTAKDGMKKYLDIVPPLEMKMAREMQSS